MNGEQQQIDFARLGSELLSSAESYLHDWLPGGKVVGNEFECGNLSGVAGRSLRVNLKSGKWADFSSNEKGGDLISLFAAIRGISQIEAAKQLSSAFPRQSIANGNAQPPQTTTLSHSDTPDDDAASLVPPPKGTKKPDFKHRKHGPATAVWTYRDGSAAVLYFISRHDTEAGKQFIPWSWRSDGRWVNRAWPEPRPLYGLESLASHPTRPVLVVEGEKACDSARVIAGHVYCVVTWQGGSQAFKKTDLKPLFGRKILLWPDADVPGVEAMWKLAAFLVEHCPEVKIIDVQGIQPAGTDAADFMIDGMNWPKFKAWAIPRAKLYAPMQVSVHKDVPASSDIEVLPGQEQPPHISVQVSSTADPEEAPVSLHAAWENMGLAMTQKQGPIVNIDNVVRVLEKWPELKGVLWFDEFHQRIRTNKSKGQPIREWLDVDDIDLTVYLQRALGMPKMTPRIVQSAVELFAYRNKRNEPKDWMESLKWDGRRRIDHFFAQAFGAEDSEYTTAASKNWWIAMAARIYDPGCKFDNMVVLEGNQGKFKSTALNIIGGQWFMESSEQIGTKDFLQSLNGKLLIEIAELDSFSKADIFTIKKTISCQVDTYRASFGRRSQDFPRRCVFVGSTNEDEYLEDPTGGRRFWPIKTGDIDLDMIREHRDQLFAEAVHRYKAGDYWWVMPKSAADEQHARRRSDVWEEAILPYLSGREEVRLLDIAVQALKFDESRVDMRSQRRIGSVLRTLGWQKSNSRRDGKQSKLWIRGDSAAPRTHDVTRPIGEQGSIFGRAPGVRNFAPGAEDAEQ